MSDKIAVLDDNTRDANVIGYAETAEEAAVVWRAYMSERAYLAEGETLEVPAFARRIDGAAVVPSFEPLL